jgi:molecular chaperone Hsp33
MENSRQEWYDAEKRVAVTIVDVKAAAQALARGHLSGPASAYCLSKALAAVALLGGECSAEDETVMLQMKCKGPLGGFNVECTTSGTLRGYTERKVLDDFDALGRYDDRLIIGERQIQVTRSVPGKILSQGVSTSLDGYLAGSLQRRACIYLEAEVSDEVEILEARGIMVESLPDSSWSVSDNTAAVYEDMRKKKGGVLAVSPRKILGKIGLSGAELKKTTPLSFACRCSPERAAALVSSMNPADLESSGEKLDITCHMCGRVYTVDR